MYLEDYFPKVILGGAIPFAGTLIFGLDKIPFDVFEGIHPILDISFPLSGLIAVEFYRKSEDVIQASAIYRYHEIFYLFSINDLSEKDRLDMTRVFCKAITELIVQMKHSHPDGVAPLERLLEKSCL